MFMLNTSIKATAWRPVMAVLILFISAVSVIDVSSQAQLEEEKLNKRIWPDNLYGVDFVDNDTGWIAGYAGTVLKTTNRGQSWDLIYIGRDELIRNLSFVDTQNGWAVGHRGSIFHTADGGASWEVQHSVPGIYLRDVHFIDGQNGWVVGHEATILHTRDGGQSWQNQKLVGYKGRDLPRLHGIEATDDKTAVLVGEFGVVALTTDAGQTWPLIKNRSKKTLLSVTAVENGYIAPGLDGVIAYLSEDDMGQYQIEWLDSGSQEHFFSASSTSDGTAIVVGRSVVLKIQQKQISMLNADSSIALPFTWFGGVDVLDDGTFWMAGIRGTVASGELAQGSFQLALNIGSSAEVRPASNRWGNGK